MIQSYEDLIDALEREFSLCIQLVELLQREKDTIALLDSRALELLLNDKKMITAAIKACDETREEILKAMGLESMTISDIAIVASGICRERLIDIASKFTSIMHTISELNRFNRILIEKSLHYVNASYNFLGTFDVSAQQKVSREV